MDAIAASILDNTSLAASDPVAVVATDILSVEIWIVVRSQAGSGNRAASFWAGRHFKFFSHLRTWEGFPRPFRAFFLKFIENLRRLGPPTRGSFSTGKKI
jgi:hypothetical protein